MIASPSITLPLEPGSKSNPEEVAMAAPEPSTVISGVPLKPGWLVPSIVVSAVITGRGLLRLIVAGTG